MSDQGEFSARWDALDADATDQRPGDQVTGPMPQANGAAEPASPHDDGAWDGRADTPEEAGAPAPPERTEFSTPALRGRTDFSTPEPSGAGESRGPEPRWESPEYEPVAEYEPVLAYEPDRDEPGDAPAAKADRRAESGPADRDAEAGEWDGAIFDGDGEGDPRYAPVMPSGPATPPKPGTPSSGNWQMPDWMAEEGPPSDSLDEGGSRRGLYIGVGLLVVALLAAAGVYFFVSGGGSSAAVTPEAKPTEEAVRPTAQLPPQKPLQHFAGQGSRVVGRVPDRHSGLAYPQLAAPWQVPNARNKLGQTGWSGQQILVTEKRAGQMWYGQLLTGTMGPVELGATGYRGPQDLQSATVLLAQNIEQREYGFTHRTRPLASQALNVGGRQGWLVGSYITYQRPGVQATGEVVVVAVVDTGRSTPAVVFAAVPNTHKRLWPDINQFVTGLTLAQ